MAAAHARRVSGLGDLLGDAPDEWWLEAGDRRLTKEQVEASARTLYEALTDYAKVPTRSPVAVILPDGPAVVAALFGVWAAGCVYVPVNPRLTATEIESALTTVDPAVVVTDREHVGLAPAALPVVVADGEVAWESRGGHRPTVALDDGVALVQWTSGTTGPPRPVPLRHDAVLALLDEVLATVSGGRPRDRAAMPNLVPVSLSLWAGIYNVLFALRVGAPVVLATPFDPRRFADLVVEHGIRSTVLPPAAMVALTDDPGIETLHPLRFVRSITAPLDPRQARLFRDRFGISVLNGYGQTELGGEVIGWSAADARDFGETKLGAVGRPHDGVDVRVVDGEIQVRTPTMNLAGDDDRLTADGFLHTGDLGRVDDDGFVWIDGRMSDVIVRGGLKVQPAEVEDVLRGHPAVVDVAVVGVADDRLGEVPVAFVVPGAGLDAPALASRCREHLAPYKVPVDFVAVEQLPRNEVGKVLRRELVSGWGSRGRS